MLDPPVVLQSDSRALAEFVRDGGRLDRRRARHLVAAPDRRRPAALLARRPVRTAKPLAPVPEVAGVTLTALAGTGSWERLGGALPVLGRDGTTAARRRDGRQGPGRPARGRLAAAERLPRTPRQRPVRDRHRRRARPSDCVLRELPRLREGDPGRLLGPPRGLAMADRPRVPDRDRLHGRPRPPSRPARARAAGVRPPEARVCRGDGRDPGPDESTRRGARAAEARGAAAPRRRRRRRAGEPGAAPRRGPRRTASPPRRPQPSHATSSPAKMCCRSAGPSSGSGERKGGELG